MIQNENFQKAVDWYMSLSHEELIEKIARAEELIQNHNFQYLLPSKEIYQREDLEPLQKRKLILVHSLVILWMWDHDKIQEHPKYKPLHVRLKEIAEERKKVKETKKKYYVRADLVMEVADHPGTLTKEDVLKNIARLLRNEGVPEEKLISEAEKHYNQYQHRYDWLVGAELSPANEETTERIEQIRKEKDYTLGKWWFEGYANLD